MNNPFHYGIIVSEALRNDDCEAVRRHVAHEPGAATDLLRVACRTGSPAMCRVLLECGAGKEAIMLNRRSALHEAASRNRLEVCRVLVEMGLDPGYVPPIPKNMLAPVGEDFRLTPFQQAVVKNALEVVKFFVLECGQDPSQRAHNNKTMLQLAAKLPAMRDLLKALKTEFAVQRAMGGAGKQALLNEDGVASQPRRSAGLSPL